MIRQTYDTPQIVKNDKYEFRQCPICKKFFYIRKKYKKITCSENCYKTYIQIHKEEINNKRSKSLKETYSKKSDKDKKIALEKYKVTCIEKYGVSSYAKTKEYKELIRLNKPDYSHRNAIINNKMYEKYKAICDEDNLDLIDFKNRFDCTVKCRKCGNIFDIHVLGYLRDETTHNLCRNCYPIRTEYSNTQPLLLIENKLKERNNEYIKNERKIIYPYEIDLYIPDYNIGIEVNGNYWHSEIKGKKDKNYHLNKTIKCENKNIMLIHIFEDETYDNNFINDIFSAYFNNDILENDLITLDRRLYNLEFVKRYYSKDYDIIDITGPSFYTIKENRYIKRHDSDSYCDGDDRIFDCGKIIIKRKDL